MARATELNKPGAAATIAPPRGLTTEAQQLWKQALRARPAAHWQGTDLDLLRLYVVAMCDVQRLTDEIGETGEVVDGRVHPLVHVRAARERIALQAATRLRLTPSSRYTGKDGARLAKHASKAMAAQAALDDDDLLAGGGSLQ